MCVCIFFNLFVCAYLIEIIGTYALLSCYHLYIINFWIFVKEFIYTIFNCVKRITGRRIRALNKIMRSFL